jgi:hypothetical protein
MPGHRVNFPQDLSTRAFRGRPHYLTVGLFSVLAAFMVTFSVRSTPPTIELIERYLTNQVLLHFDTDANRTYVLQYTDRAGTNGFATSTWSNLYTAPSTPFPNHYIVVAYRTNAMRFFRLKVTP